MTAYTNGEAQKRMDRQTNGKMNKKNFIYKNTYVFCSNNRPTDDIISWKLITYW